MHEPEVVHADVTVDGFDGEPSRAAPAHLVPSPQELANARQDMVVDRRPA
jgi:hypothetical protein